MKMIPEVRNDTDEQQNPVEQDWMHWNAKSYLHQRGCDSGSCCSPLMTWDTSRGIIQQTLHLAPDRMLLWKWEC